VTKDELERFGGTTLKDVLERVPSLIGTTVYMTDRTLMAARGDQVLASGSHVLLLINGRPVRESLEAGIKGEVLETFPVDVIKQIEVIRGPGSVLYGTEAFSAAINIITEKPEHSGVTVLGQAGPDSQYRGAGKVMVSSGDLSLIASGQYQKRPEWSLSYEYPNLDGSMGSVDSVIPNEGLGAFMDLSYKGFRLTSSHNEWDHAYFISELLAIFPASGTANWKKDFLNAGLHHEEGDMWDMDFNVTYSRSRFTVSSFPSIERDSYTLIGEWTNSVRLNDETRLVFGALYEHVDGNEMIVGDGTSTDVSDATRDNLGLYTQVDYRATDSLNVIGGIQVNKIEGVDVGVVPRAGLIWRPAPRVHVKAFYSKAFRAPSINELSLDFPTLQGNPDLKPEKVGTFDLSVAYQGKRGRVAATYFLSQQSQIIIQDSSQDPGFYDNLGEVDFRGFELEGKLYATDELLFTGSTLYFTSEDGDGNRDVTPIASFGFKAGVSYASDNGITVSLFDIYQGDLADSYDTEFNTSPGAYNRLNLYLRASFKELFRMSGVEDLAFVGQVDNLFDKEVWLPAWGLSPSASLPVIQGRSVYLGLELSL
jgi:outer membrane receptor for ferrienterochelin and colicins